MRKPTLSTAGRDAGVVLALHSTWIQTLPRRRLPRARQARVLARGSRCPCKSNEKLLIAPHKACGIDVNHIAMLSLSVYAVICICKFA